MKKKILLALVLSLVACCMLAISVSAQDVINKSSSSEFGELTIFDEPIGNMGIGQNKDDGTIARSVIFDGTSYYTVPTTYILKEYFINQNGKSGEMLVLDFGPIGTKLGASFDKNSIIRSEIPADIDFICSGNENYSGCANLVEISVPNGLRIWDNGQRKVFTNCKKLESADISGMVLDGTVNTFAMFEYCESLKSVILPDAYEVNGVPLNYDTDHMFSGCKNLTHIGNLQSFFKGVESLGYKTFYNCHNMTEFTLWDSLEAIEGRAFGNCSSITSIIIPDSVNTIGTNETVFESCTSLKKIVLPAGPVSLGQYCFEKCTGLTDVWMPTNASTFEKQVFGQCGSNLAVNFHFSTASNTVTVNNKEHNRDPYITAINAQSDERLIYNVPAATKCTLFIGEHTNVAQNACVTNCTVCKSVFVEHNEAENISVSIVYADFAAQGDKTTVCNNKDCTYCVEAKTEAILSGFGYSTKIESETKSGLVFSYIVNKAALADYEAANKTTVSLGVLAVAEHKAADTVVNADGTVAIDNVVAAPVGATSAVDLIIWGSPNAWEATDEETGKAVKDIAFYFSAYVIEGQNVSYVCANTSKKLTDMVKKTYTQIEASMQA